MAKSTFATMITRLKRRIDYNIFDDDLDNLLIDCINDANKILFQHLLDNGFYNEIGQSTTLSLIAATAYIDISTALAGMSELIKVSERTNDKPIEIISYPDFVSLYPDPTANTSTRPDHCALWGDKLYVGPTPSANASNAIYADYVGPAIDGTSGSTLPYKTKFDPLVLAIARVEYLNFYNKKDRNTIVTAQEEMKYYLDTLVIKAAKNIGMVRQTASRRDTRGWGPRIPE